MKRFVLFFLGLLIFSNIISAQIKVIDATDNSPIPAASILDASGNLIGITLINGDLPNIPKSAYPITVRSMIEIYLVDNTFLSNDEAKQEYKDKDRGLDFTIPSTIPPLNDATQNMVTRAKNKK